MHYSREAVITGLTLVDVIVGVHGLVTDLAAENLDCPVGDNLVGVHVGLSA